MSPDRIQDRIEAMNGLRGDPNKFAYELNKLASEHPRSEKLLEFLIEVANDPPHAFVHGQVVALLAKRTDALDRVIPVIAHALQHGDGYGGGWSETVQCDAMYALAALGPMARGALPALKQELAAEGFADDNGGRTARHLLAAIAGYEEAAAFTRELYLKWGQTLENWANDLLDGGEDAVLFLPILEKDPDHGVQRAIRWYYYAESEFEKCRLDPNHDFGSTPGSPYADDS